MLNIMQLCGKPIRVKLRADLTKYDPRCKVGEYGWTMPDVKLSVWGSHDPFVAVKFDNGAMLDVFDKSLEFLDVNKTKKESIIQTKNKSISQSKLF